MDLVELSMSRDSLMLRPAVDLTQLRHYFRPVQLLPELLRHAAVSVPDSNDSEFRVLWDNNDFIKPQILTHDVLMNNYNTLDCFHS